MALKFKIFTGSSHPKLANEISELIGQPLGKINLSTFSCGEKYMNLDETVRGHDVFLVQTCRAGTVNEDYMELFLMCDTMKRSFANKVHVILPHFGYTRQDKIHLPREPISAKVMADLIVTAGADHVVTVQLHSDQNQGFFNVPVDNLNANKIMAAYIAGKKLKDLVIVSPDAGGAKNAKRFADLLNAPIAILHKTRPAHNVSLITHVVGDVKGKTCLIFDDMIDTGGSVLGAKQALLKAGANKDVYLCATHPIFSGNASRNLSKAKFKEVIVTNTIPVSKEKQFKGLKILTIAPLLANVIDSVTNQKSVSSLYY